MTTTTTSDAARNQLLLTLTQLDRFVVCSTKLSLAEMSALSQCIMATERVINLGISPRTRFVSVTQARDLLNSVPRKINRTHGGLLDALRDCMTAAECIFLESLPGPTDA